MRFPGVTVSSAFWALTTLGYAWWATGLETFSGESTAAIVGGGTAAVALGTWQRWRRRQGGRSRDVQADDGAGRARRESRLSRKPGLSVWLVLLGVLAALQAFVFTRGPREDYPTISSIINGLLDTHGARSVACAAWLAGGLRLGRGPGSGRDGLPDLAADRTDTGKELP